MALHSGAPVSRTSAAESGCRDEVHMAKDTMERILAAADPGRTVCGDCEYEWSVIERDEQYVPGKYTGSLSGVL